MADGFHSYAAQTLHYFTRPHEAVPKVAIGGPAAWRGDELDDAEWQAQLSADQIQEIETAVAAVRESGRPLSELSRDDFRWPALSDAIARWREQVAAGLGFVLVRGLPVERWDRADVERCTWGLGLHLGKPGAQNPDGDLLGHVTDTGDDRSDPMVRLYRTAADIAYHCDAADAVGLVCLRTAKKGGASRIASSVRVFDELLAREPALAARLFQPVRLDLRNEQRVDMQGFLEVVPCCASDGALRTFYHSDYFRSAARHAPDGKLGATEQALFDAWEAIALSPGMYLDMDLEPGDFQLLSNHTIVHARTAYEDHAEADRRRHLLRLWLSF